MQTEAYNPIIRWNPTYKRFEVESETHAGHFYSITYNISYDELTCTCPWGRGQAKRTRKQCKHVIAVNNWLKNEINRAQVNME